MMMRPHPWRDEEPFDPLARIRQTLESLVIMGVILAASLGSMAFLIRSLAFISLSIGFLEAACVNGLYLLAGRRPREWRRRFGALLLPIFFLPIVGLAAMAWMKLEHPLAPDGTLMASLAAGTTGFRFFGAMLLAGCKIDPVKIVGPALRSSWLDLLCGGVVVIAGIATGETHSWIPDAIAAAAILFFYVLAPLRTWRAAQNKNWLNPEDWLG